MRYKKAKIKEILKRADEQFASFALPKVEIKNRLFQQIKESVTETANERSKIRKEFFKLKLYRLATVSLVALIILLLAGAGAVYASEQTGPDNLLYPLKRKVETIHLAITKDPIKRSKLQLDFLQKREKEWQKLQEINKDSSTLTSQELSLMVDLSETFNQSLDDLAKVKSGNLSAEKKAALDKQLEKIRGFADLESQKIKLRQQKIANSQDNKALQNLENNFKKSFKSNLETWRPNNSNHYQR